MWFDFTNISATLKKIFHMDPQSFIISYVSYHFWKCFALLTKTAMLFFIIFKDNCSFYKKLSDATINISGFEKLEILQIFKYYYVVVMWYDLKKTVKL